MYFTVLFTLWYCYFYCTLNTSSCFYIMCPLASPSPGLPGTSEWLTDLWCVEFGEEGAFSACCIFLFLPHLCPSCSWVWHTTSSPSPQTHSWSASWWASSATSLLSPQTPWCTGALRTGEWPHCYFFDRWWWVKIKWVSPSLMFCCSDVTNSGHTRSHVAITQAEAYQGQGRQSDKAQTHRLGKHTLSLTHTCL